MKIWKSILIWFEALWWCGYSFRGELPQTSAASCLHNIHHPVFKHRCANWWFFVVSKVGVVIKRASMWIFFLLLCSMRALYESAFQKWWSFTKRRIVALRNAGQCCQHKSSNCLWDSRGRIGTNINDLEIRMLLFRTQAWFGVRTRYADVWSHLWKGITKTRSVF